MVEAAAGGRGGAAQLRLLHRHSPGGWNGIDRLVDAIRAFDGSAGVVETAAGALGLPVLLVAAAALFSSLMSYVQQYIIATVGEELTLSLRQDVSAQAQPPAPALL